MAAAGAEQRGGPHRVRHARAHRARQGKLLRHYLLPKLNGRKNYLRKKTFIEIFHTTASIEVHRVEGSKNL